MSIAHEAVAELLLSVGIDPNEAMSVEITADTAEVHIRAEMRHWEDGKVAHDGENVMVYEDVRTYRHSGRSQGSDDPALGPDAARWTPEDDG